MSLLVDLENDGYEEELRTLEEQENNINLKISGHEGELGVSLQLLCDCLVVYYLILRMLI